MDKENRKAQFRTSICLNLDGKQFLFNGICKGEILTRKARGKRVLDTTLYFNLKGLNKSFAQMTSRREKHH